MQKKLFFMFLLLFFVQFDSNAATLLILAPILLVLIVNKNEFYLFKEVKQLTLIVLISIIMGGVSAIRHSDLSLYNYIKDFSYFIQAPIYCYAGYALVRQSGLKYAELVKLIVLSITAISIINLSKIPFQLPSFSTLGLVSRYSFDFSNQFALLSFIIVYNYRFVGLRLFNKKVDTIILVISFLSILVSFSRTGYLILCLVALVPYMTRYRFEYKAMLLILLLVLGNIFGGEFVNIKSYSSGNTTFISKLQNSLSEVVIRKMDNREDIIKNWRAYEASLGLQEYLNGDAIELIFGKGLGSNAKTPSWVFKGSTEGDTLDVLPIFHNGFITVLLKSGVVGLVILMVFLFQLSRSFYPSNNKKVYLAMLCKVSIGFMIVSSTLVTHGLFYKQAPFILLFSLGAVSAFLNKAKNESKN